ncbi:MULTISPECIES: hypothetical protein [Halomicrobium]|uniref:Uncharacterized protein n=1 Tax=Halomicrobium mukohataei (strain ATCC 700874 / DSM 12286 / JCM 9738 / NCIMB 13541) TaxID=485914 RepID=C7NXT6_HALMD|nr:MULTISPECIES: hypothetical protein [Halomicrobium]ACV46524.1 hypothetical protein Hmuk_0389 [Halomicrobium mukohataei DSM 12286]
MATTTAPDDRAGEPATDRPSIDVCETCPGSRTFIESDNTEGWIATDLVVDVRR